MNNHTNKQTSLPDGLDAIFVIHVTSFKDRAVLIESQMAERGLPFEYILDYDIPDMPEYLQNKLFKQDIDLSPAQRSCAMKHWQAHRLISDRQLKRALVLEDDVILSKNFMQALDGLMKEEVLLIEPHVTFLGCGGHYYVPHEEIQSGRWIYPRNQGKFADSYIISCNTAKRRLDWIDGNGIPTAIDHAFEYIDRTLGTPMYWLEPPAVEQGSHNGRFASALEDSGPLWLQTLKYKWKKIWRRRHHTKTVAK